MNTELRELLKAHSRSFYLSLRVLPPRAGDVLAVGYLMARTLDNVCDGTRIPRAERLAALQSFRESCATEVNAQSPGTAGRVEWPRMRRSDAGAELVRAWPQIVDAYARLPLVMRQATSQVLRNLSRAMATDLTTLAEASQRHTAALETRAELEAYTFDAAGCVGEYWSRVLVAQVVPDLAPELERLQTHGRDLGCALQWINVLRDLRQDLAQGRCYLPRAELAAHGLTPELLRTGAAQIKVREAFRPLFNTYIERARELMGASKIYVDLLPPTQRRLRLAVLWPSWIGIETLTLLARCPDPLRQRVKVPRARVYALMGESLWRVGNSAMLARGYQERFAQLAQASLS